MHDTTSTSQEQVSLREENVVALPPVAKTASIAVPAKAVQQHGLMQFLKRFFYWVFTGRRVQQASASNQMPTPVVFKGDATCALATPLSGYAGKPVEQALRRRAEQQFMNMDTNKATMN